ncbi:ABC transporter permease [Brevibacillus parabrevis]|uniref:ABC transporter permease n=1 Tax=Brevibacillus parabrevis TaxID=54914 RepID=A0A4Y3PNT3_BREPA|nr:ABC transporter permease [Brevibacillus parabrevis]RNB97544.1 ABC transporter permease [Brevibacillus parabrevis]GEB33636.1 ABC transporter permease [Brevibacillus parabrevis]
MGGSWFSSAFGKKCIQYVLVLAVALTINFALPRLAPGDPLEFFFGESTINELTPQQRQQVEHELGLDRSLWQQYADFMTGVFRFDLGSSIKYGKPVTEVLADRLPWTFLLVAPSLIVSAVIGIAIGAYAAWNRGKRRDLLFLTGMLTIESIPGFWIGMLLIAVFSVSLGWFPSFGAVPIAFTGGGMEYVLALLKHMTLPVITITLATIGGNFLLTRSSMLDTLGQDYVLMAEAKGAVKRSLIFNHALRNALLPVYTHITMSLGILVSGAVVVETVFSYPGVGRLLYESVIARDYPMMQGVFLIITLGVIAANLLADLTYPLFDPRARQRKQVEESP